MGPMDSKKPETTSTWKMAMKAEEPEGKTGHVRGRLFSLEATRSFCSQDLQNDTFVKIMTQLGSDNWCL